MDEMKGRIENLRAAWEQYARTRRDTLHPGLATFPLSVTVEYGKRYAKLVRREQSSSAVAGFVDLQTGNILYPKSWRGPVTNNPRGNVSAADFGLSAFNEYGVKTLR